MCGEHAGGSETNGDSRNARRLAQHDADQIARQGPERRADSKLLRRCATE
jgi:hypothetical protein